jgi:hypothetical protein
MYRGFNQDMRAITMDDLLLALQAQVPLSISQREVVESLRRWLQEGRAVPDSATESRETNGSGRIRLDPVGKNS